MDDSKLQACIGRGVDRHRPPATGPCRQAESDTPKWATGKSAIAIASIAALHTPCIMGPGSISAHWSTSGAAGSDASSRPRGLNGPYSSGCRSGFREIEWGDLPVGSGFFILGACGCRMGKLRRLACWGAGGFALAACLGLQDGCSGNLRRQPVTIDGESTW